MQLTEEQIERLRQSGIRLDKDGRFWHEDAEVTHGGMRAAFFRWLSRNPDGRYVLRLDDKRFVYLDVDDAPFVVRSARWQGDALVGLLSDGTEESVKLESLRRTAAGAYVTVKGGFDARLSTQAWAVLAEKVVEENGQPALVVGQKRFPIA